jgi:acyl-CoA synthetase (AMP-forming)/AMP-acid ligase II
MNKTQVQDLLTTLPLRVRDILFPWEKRSPEKLALVEASGSWTYAQLGQTIEQIQATLQELGIRPGDRVMIVCENCRAFMAIFLALTAMDAWPVLVNARLSAQEVDQIREHCGARRVFYTVGVSPHAMKHAKRHEAEIREPGDWGPIGVGPLNGQVRPEPLEESVASNVAALIYTSGTTGLPKGVMLSHRNVLFMARLSAEVRSLTPEDRLLGILPMSHAVGLSVVALGTLISGGTLYLSARFDPVALLHSLEKDRITILMGTPSMFALLVDYAKLKELRNLRFPSLRVITSSGAPLTAALKADVEALFGMTLHNGYGVTECSPTIALTRIATPRTDTSVGRIFPGTEVRLVDGKSDPVRPGEIGELHVRGPNVMKGYYRAREETSAAIDEDGWFNTRDLARFDGDHLFIVGRTKELIVRFGFNVYPAEVEAVLNACPGVVRSAVIGQTVGGEEEVVAFVQLQPGSTGTADDVAKYASNNLAPYKQPSRIFVVKEIPLTPTGKPKKEELAKLLSEKEQAN